MFLYIRISRSKKHKTGWKVYACFEIELHFRDKLLLENLLITLVCGTVNKHSKDAIVFIISGLENKKKFLFLYLLNMRLKELNP
jgi:hypothetical protein